MNALSTPSSSLNALRLLARVPVTAVIAAAALATAAIPGLAATIQFDRAAIAAGDAWRLVTCHLTHWNGEHLLWDLLMFVVLGAICEWRNPRQMRLCVAISAVAVAMSVLWAFPGIQLYRGLSGIDTALFTLLAIDLLYEAWRDRNPLQAMCTGGLLLALTAKIAYEAIGGQTIFVEQDAADFVPLVWDHVAGAAAGIVIATCGKIGFPRPQARQLAFPRPAA